MTLPNQPPYNTLKPKATSTVGRGKVVKLDVSPSFSQWSDENDIIWEPFGGLFSASLAARQLNRKAYSCEIDPDYFYWGTERFNPEFYQYSLHNDMLI